MAKNIYKKYRAVETFQKDKKEVTRDMGYDFQSDNTYTIEQKTKLKVIQDAIKKGADTTAIRIPGTTSFNAKSSYEVSADKQSFNITGNATTIQKSAKYSQDFYLNLDSFYASGAMLLLKSGLAGYESGGDTLVVINLGYTGLYPNEVYASKFRRVIHLEKVSAGFEKGEYLGEVEAEAGTYPLEQNYNGYWYEYDRPANYPPQISGSDYDMGSQTENFDIEYYVTDQNDDSVDVKILLDDIQKETKKVFNNQKNIYNVDISKLNLGQHAVKIIATDSFGASDTRIYTFYKSNVAPKISGQDKDLGGKSLGFTINYDITDSDGDEVDVTISLNNEELSNITTNSKNGLTFTLSDDKVKTLTIGDIYTITIKADDRKGGIAYRRYTFTKINSVPVISGNDKDLGEKSETFSHTFSVTDYEKDPISFRVKLDGKVIKEVKEVEDGQDYQIDITQEELLKLSYGKHTIKIEAWDSINQDKIQVRELTFTRVSNGLDVEIKLATSSVQPKKIIAVPHGVFASDATLQVLVCNNYLDSSPTWEDATEMSNLARAYAFENTVKEGDEWAIGIKVLITDGESGEISILKGVKGGFE